jgi:methylglutaconyl-CoA hydratase
MNSNVILTETKGATATIWLNRPEKRNAFNLDMISQLLFALQCLNKEPQIRFIIIRGKGSVFSSGADLNWMYHSASLSADENYWECEALATCFYEIYQSNRIVICLVHGLSFGGANGLIAAADIVVAEESAMFSFSEVRMGILPATIAPYVVKKTGQSKAGELMLTGKRFNASLAKEYGLVGEVVPGGQLESYSEALISSLMEGASITQSAIKAMLHMPDMTFVNAQTLKQSAAMLAESRIKREAAEGINAFFNKRKPSWTSSQL